MANCYYICFVYGVVFSHFNPCSLFLTVKKISGTRERRCTAERRTKSISISNDCCSRSTSGWIYYCLTCKRFDGYYSHDSGDYSCHYWHVPFVYPVKCVYDSFFKKTKINLLEENEYDFVIRCRFPNER